MLVRQNDTLIIIMNNNIKLFIRSLLCRTNNILNYFIYDNYKLNSERDLWRKGILGERVWYNSYDYK